MFQWKPLSKYVPRCLQNGIIVDPTDLVRFINKRLTVLKQKWEIATQLLEESVDLRIMTVEDFRTVQVKME